MLSAPHDPTSRVMALTLTGLALLGWLMLALRLGRKPRPGWRVILTEAACLALVEIAGVWVAWPFFHPHIVGLGDATHYTLQIADAVTQARSGTFPVFVGQSIYAFNGGVHTLRTAPYFTNLGIFLDLLTARSLPFPALANLTLVLSSLGGALAAYACARRLLSGARWVSALLAVTYTLGPGLSVPAIHYDLFATYLTAPWQPIFWLGLALSLRETDDREGLFWSVFALGTLWSVHPPTALWLTPAFVATQLARLTFAASGWRIQLKHWLVAAAGFALLTAFPFYSVLSLGLGYSPAATGGMEHSIIANLRAAWPGSLLPFAYAKGHLQNLQLGYSLWALLAVGCAFRWRAGPAGWVFKLCTAVYLLLLLPVPGVTLWLWRHMPPRVLDMTNDWPMHRFYLILSGLAVVSAALFFGRLLRERPRAAPYLVAGLAVAAIWSAAEAARFRRHGFETRGSAATTNRILAPANLNAGRSSYLLFGRYPSHFSHGRMDPEFELRLVDANSTPILINSQKILRSAAPASPAPAWREIQDEISFQADGRSDLLLEFAFPSADAAGYIVVKGQTVEFAYEIPTFGEVRAFGAKPESDRTIVARFRGEPAQRVAILSKPPGTRMRIWPFAGERDLPLRLASLMPLKVKLQDPSPAAVLETPRMFIPGYTARVDGRATAVQRLPDGLAGVPLPAGAREIVVEYPGPFGLRGLYYAALAAWTLLAGAAFLLGTGLSRRRET